MRVARHRNNGQFAALERRQNFIDFFRLPRKRNSQNYVAGHNHPQVSVQGFYGVDKERGSSCRGQGSGNFAADDTTFTNAQHHYATFTVSHYINGFDKLVVDTFVA